MSELATIDANLKKALKQLETKYASYDKAKSSFGYIGITFLSVLFGSIFLNDFFKLCIHLLELFGDWRQKRSVEQQRTTKEEIDRKNEIAIEFERLYADDLEERLERFHVALIRAQMAREIREKE